MMARSDSFNGIGKQNHLRLYLHIPFCARKCRYCDFVSFAGKEAVFPAYIAALCNEIRAWGAICGSRKISSVYIGGGTPSILPPEQMEQLAESLYGSFQISGTKEKRKGLRRRKVRPVTEFSIECNPKTIDEKKLKTYKKLGINRLSFGLQSADPKELKQLGRIHSFADFAESFEAAREAGFDNINADLLQAVPGQTLAGWKRTMALLAAQKPEHISAYSLIVEEGTPFFEQREKGLLKLPDEDTERDIYYYTRDFLESCGYKRYEISNYAVPGFECRHNTGYWKRDPYLGLGLGAASMINNVRWKNTEDLEAYIKAFSDESKAEKTIKEADVLHQKRGAGPASEPERGGGILKDVQKLSHQEQMEEYMFLGLRMAEGISKQEFFAAFGQDFDFTYGNAAQELKAKGLLNVTEDRVFLTDRGIDVSNQVLAEFLFA